MDTVRNINHFIAIEEENLLTSIENLGDDFFLIHNLDELFKIGSHLNPINEKSHKIPSFLYLITHSEFYTGMVSFLRIHISKSFTSLRSALDCTFTAYYLLKYPDKVDVYLSKIKEEDNPEWKKIFLNIKRTIKEDINNFPQAKGLPEIHEYCSIYAHSDAIGILHRYSENKESLEAKFFDYEVNTDDYKKWLACLLTAFLNIYSIYWDEIFKHNVGENMEKMKYKITEYQKKLKIFQDKYPLGKSS
ncbi:SAM-dependent methyltransferase [Candidatus Scalindua japonica]|uniref:SAM-dependent methyltransferase n=1 Tax=Candidatus Scalindua japonica TaxID=1284222 RepID=A0A286TYF2_9BACT|nr:hypothetical protein [Candidatus Scalindua japonica]GAX60925.1 SAM-dependent methyltransferase [Candidatus Scalindua japonica]